MTNCVVVLVVTIVEATATVSGGYSLTSCDDVDI